MAKHKYLTSPPNLTGMPPGVPYIIGNEAAERFSYYGMKSVLTVFMAHYILNQSGVLASMSPNEAYMYTHYFVMGVYALPVLGAIIADGLLGKFWTILSLSIVYCLGNLNRTTDDARNRIEPDLPRRGRHQALCIGQRWRSVWRNQQASAFKDVWLVLFLD
jgi:proton-dependent oligopeptide transporter, POT family